MSLLQGLIDENVDRHTRDLVTLTATASITSADHAGRTLLMGEVGGNAAATFTLPAAVEATVTTDCTSQNILFPCGICVIYFLLY